jgi:hypothetical protein
MNLESTGDHDRSAQATATFLLGLAYLALRKIGSIGDSDVWWHLRTGDIIRAQGEVPSVDPFSWTATGEPWQPNAWLSDVLFSWMREVGDLAAISLYRSVGVLTIGSLMWWVLRRHGSGAWSALAAGFFGMLLMMPFITERPQLFGFAAFGVLMLIMPAALCGSKRALLGLGLLLVFWANLHGSFIMGVGVVGLVAFGCLASDRRWRAPVIAVTVATAAPLANPYGWNVYRRALTIPGVSQFIEEWRSFDITDARDQLIALFVLVAIFGIARSGLWRSWDLSLPLAALTILTARAIRTAPFLLMWAMPYVAAALSSLAIPRLRSWAAARATPLATGLLVAGTFLAGSMLTTISDAGAIDRTSAPVEVVDSLPTGCRLLNEYEFGGLVIDRRWPEIRVSQDGRNDLYGLDRIEQQEAWLGSEDLGPLHASNITCVLARPDRALADALRASEAWSVRLETDSAIGFAAEG